MSALGAGDRRTLATGIISILSILVLGRGVPAWQRWTGDARDEAIALTTRRARVEQTLAQAAVTRESLHVRKRRFVSLAPLLVDGSTPAAAAAALSGIVSGAALTAGLRMGSVQLRSDTSGLGHFRRVAVRVDLVGDVHGLTAFLASLERGPALLAVRELSVTQPDATAPADRMEMLRVQVLVEGLALARHRAELPARRAER